MLATLLITIALYETVSIVFAVLERRANEARRTRDKCAKSLAESDVFLDKLERCSDQYRADTEKRI